MKWSMTRQQFLLPRHTLKVAMTFRQNVVPLARHLLVNIQATMNICLRMHPPFTLCRPHHALGRVIRHLRNTAPNVAPTWRTLERERVHHLFPRSLCEGLLSVSHLPAAGLVPVAAPLAAPLRPHNPQRIQSGGRWPKVRRCGPSRATVLPMPTSSAAVVPAV
eukprot:TRINITY_DN24853_c0_g1_i1.p2 TRINITY_DN24853_c0_g1~~TRINITY_DN24853_c0_g1_i1.p2  ORF type:complete len:163 (-),score=0.15 TRINITY_DN24853_c0_g1_i1:51-539(-)